MFEIWLGEIAVLTEAQRRRDWQVLASSEAWDSGGKEMRKLG
jgi:hypothetical protein